MDRVIKNLRAQLILCRRLIGFLTELEEKLKESTAGQGITPTVQSIEKLMPELSKADAELQEILRAESIENLEDYVDRQPDSVERSVAQRLLKQVGIGQTDLQKKMFNAATLLINSKKFIDFNINVMSAARVGPTYGKHGNTTNAAGGRSLFDTGI